MQLWPFVSKAKFQTLQTEIDDIKQRSIGGVNIPGELLNKIIDADDNVKNVTEETALNLSAFYRAIYILCDSLNVPISVYKRDEDNDRNLVTQDDIYEYQVHKLLRVSPNRMHTPSEWMQLMETSRLIYGNGYSLILWNGMAEPIAFRWVHPNNVEVRSDGKELRYWIRNEDGSYFLQNIPAKDMLHVKNMSDGVIGHGIIEYAAESMGLGLSAQQAGSKFFGGGMTAKYVLSHPGSLKPEGRKNLGDSFKREMKAGNTVVTEEGIKPFILSIPPEQAQFIETQRFGVSDISRWTGVPEYLLSNNDPTYSNIQNFGLSFVTYNVRGRARIYEQEFNMKLLGNYAEFYSHFNLNALLRADLKTRYDSYAIAIQNRIMNPNEARALEDMNSYEGGDKFENPNITTGEAKKTEEE